VRRQASGVVALGLVARGRRAAVVGVCRARSSPSAWSGASGVLPSGWSRRTAPVVVDDDVALGLHLEPLALEVGRDHVLLVDRVLADTTRSRTTSRLVTTICSSNTGIDRLPSGSVSTWPLSVLASGTATSSVCACSLPRSTRLLTPLDVDVPDGLAEPARLGLVPTDSRSSATHHLLGRPWRR
jgi:hypothetical protein